MYQQQDEIIVTLTTKLLTSSNYKVIRYHHVQVSLVTMVQWVFVDKMLSHSIRRTASITKVYATQPAFGFLFSYI